MFIYWFFCIHQLSICYIVVGFSDTENNNNDNYNKKKKNHKQNLVSGLKKSIVQSGENLKACEVSTTKDTCTGVGPN